MASLPHPPPPPPPPLSHAALHIYTGDVSGMIAVQAAIKFNGGGHINHSIFWENLSPQGGSLPAGKPCTHKASELHSISLARTYMYAPLCVSVVHSVPACMYMNFILLSLVCSVLSSTGDLLMAIERDFGSFDEFRAEMTAKTVAIKGSGWGWLVSEGGGR